MSFRPRATDEVNRGALIALAQPTGPRDHFAAIEPLDRDQATFLDLVAEHRLGAALVDALRKADRLVPDTLRESLAGDQIARLQLRRTLEVVLSALGDHLPWAVVKGPAVAAAMKRPDLRTYNDLDLLIPGRYLAEAIDRLQDAGVRELNRNWVPYLKHEVGELPMAGQYSTVDVHWDLVPLGWIRRSVRFDVEGMLTRSGPVDMEGLGLVPVLNPVDQLLHMATHCALAGALRLDQFRDLAVIAEQLTGPEDWTIFVSRARAAGAARLAGHALDRADQTVGVPAPDRIYTDLAGSTIALRRLMETAPFGPRRVMVTVWRDSGRETVRALGRQAVGSLADRLGHRASWDFGDKQSALYYGRDTGGAEGRSRYLAMAAATYGSAATK